MKVLTSLFLIICIAVSCKKQHNDVSQNTSVICFDTVSFRTNIQEPLQAIFFVNDKTGFIAGNRGGIYKTTDSAKTWVSLSSAVNLPIRSLHFTDSLIGFAVGGRSFCSGIGCTPPGGFILKTLNGGLTWTKVYIPSDKIELNSIYFINSSIGYCVGNNVVVKTNDGGQSWSEYKINSLGGQMMHVKFTDLQNGYIVCLFGKIITTKDGGTTWQVKDVGGTTGYYSLSESNGSIYVSGQGKIIKSFDNGSSWNELQNSPNDIFAVHFVTDKRGFAFGRGIYSGGDFGYSYGSMYCTDNGGATWNGSGEIKTVGLISAVSFPTKNLGYAVSGNLIIRLHLE